MPLNRRDDSEKMTGLWRREELLGEERGGETGPGRKVMRRVKEV